MIVTFSRLGRFGRLGNQLFQIASTLGIARRNAAQAIFPVWRYAQFFTGPIPQSVNPPGEFPTCLEQSFTYQPIELAGSVDLAGFFQSERYFSSIAPEIRQVLSPCESIREQCQSQLPSLLGAGTCSIHVRRGDYVYHPLYADLAATDYYERAMSHFPAETSFMMISDDLEYCRQRFRDRRITFIECENEVAALCIMTLCRSNIIANSSFSWWGAWLNQNADRKVVAPQHWFAGQYADPEIPFVMGPPHWGFQDTRDLIPDGWMRI